MKFVTLISFTEQGVREFKHTTSRATRFRQQAEASGLHIHQLLWTLGGIDGLIVFEASDQQTASKAMLSLAARGSVRTETLPAFDFPEMQQIVDSVTE